MQNKRPKGPSKPYTESNNLITESELESWLYTAANILRGPINAADFKTYIFPLLFLKRICDVFDSEYLQAEKIGGELFPENYQFIIPGGCHWKDLRERAENIGQAISSSMYCIEKANPDLLWGIFGDADWSNKKLFKDELLKDLIEHFSQHNLAPDVVGTHMVGRAYEYLIKQFADESNKAAGEYYTPRAVIRLLTKILVPQEGESIYDSCVGTAGMLLEARHYVESHGGNPNRLWLYGQESNLTAASIARMNLILHGIEDAKIVRGDTIRNPAFFEGDQLAVFDCCLTNPPFSLKKWGDKEWENDKYGRNLMGNPPASFGDYAFVLHNIASMAKSKGRMAIVLPRGALFREGAEKKIRQKIMDLDLLDAVIGFAPNLFYGTTLDACALILRKNKPAKRKNQVQFIDASKQFRVGKNQNELLERHVDQIYDWYKAYEDVPGISRIESADDIQDKNYSFNLARYVGHIIHQDSVSVEEAFSRFVEAHEEQKVAEKRLTKLLMEAEDLLW